MAAAAVHRGEEPPLCGTEGSGNVFFSGCNLSCLFCQNYPISRLGTGRDMSASSLAAAFLRLQGRSVHNVNLVSPTPWIPQILEALAEARERGFHLPVVYNSGGYDSLEALALLDGAIDIYLPDMKYATGRAAWRYSRAAGYVESNRLAVAEMMRQVGPLEVDGQGIARRGVLVRHLVLPGETSETEGVLDFLAAMDPAPPLSLMFQYFPAFRAVGHPLLGRPLWRDECAAVEARLFSRDIEGGWVQDYG